MELRSVLSDNLERQDECDGREAQEGWDTWINIADSCCTAETNMIS